MNSAALSLVRAAAPAARLGVRSYVRPSQVVLAGKKDEADPVKQLVLGELRKYAADLDAKKKKAVPVPDAIRSAAEAELEAIKRRDGLQHVKVELPKSITLD